MALGKSLGRLAKALRMAARKFGPEDHHLDDGEYGPDPGATATADQAAQTVKRPDGNGHVIASWPLRVWLPTSWSPTLVSPSEDEDED